MGCKIEAVISCKTAASFNSLWTVLFFPSIFESLPKIGSYRLPTHGRDAHKNFFMIPSYFKIKIFAKLN